MKIFISLKAPGENEDLRTASLALAEAARAAGHTPFVAWREIEAQGFSPPQFMPFVREHLRASAVCLVLYHPELRGGLIELGIAYAYGIPIWLVHRSNERVSSSALGCADLVLQYASLEELQKKIFGVLYTSVIFSIRES